MKKHPLNCRFFSIVPFFILVGIHVCCGQKRSTGSIVRGEIGEKIDRSVSPIIESVISSWDLPGVAIGVVKDQKIVFAKAFGYANVETREPATIHTLYHMASISKPFVATAVLQLVEQGRICLDSSLIHYLPYFRMDSHLTRKITIRQMLNHISGMPDVEDYEWDNPVYDEGALERYVRRLSSLRLLSPPGERFSYSNMAFECLGDLIAKVSGYTFDDYEKLFVLNPSGMTESTFLKPDSLPENWAAPHMRILSTQPWNGYPYNRMHGPSSTLHSNVVEMCRWAALNLNRGTLDGTKVLNAASYDLLWKSWFRIEEDREIGLSWFLGKYRGKRTVEHGGSDTGFNTSLVLMPEESVGVVVLCNFNPAPVRMIANAVLDVVLGFEPGSVRMPASIPVCRKLESEGVDAAVELWNSLKEKHSQQYDFDPRQFGGLFVAMQMDLVEPADLLTRLCLKIFSEDIVRIIQKEAERHLEKNPESKAATAILNAIKGR